MNRQEACRAAQSGCSLTRLVLDVVLGAAPGGHLAEVHLLVEDLHLSTSTPGEPSEGGGDTRNQVLQREPGPSGPPEGTRSIRSSRGNQVLQREPLSAEPRTLNINVVRIVLDLSCEASGRHLRKNNPVSPEAEPIGGGAFRLFYLFSKLVRV